jgi:hypothetical protein
VIINIVSRLLKDEVRYAFVTGKPTRQTAILLLDSDLSASARSLLAERDDFYLYLSQPMRYSGVTLVLSRPVELTVQKVNTEILAGEFTLELTLA